MPSLTRPPRARQQRIDDRRSDFELRVLAALEELLADGTPYTELAVQRIAAAAEVARSTFYRYFPDKSHLLIRMAELATADLFGTAERWWRADHGDAPATVVAAMHRMITGAREHRWVLSALTEVAAYDRDVAAYWRARVDRFTGLIRERLTAEQRAGRVDPTVDVAATAIVLTAMVEQSINVGLGDPPNADDRLATALGRAIWLIVYGTAPAG